jgi:hypothetical protein
MAGDCGQTNFENRLAPLSSYSGDTLKFRFHAWSDSIINYQGGYFDNFGILVSNYGQGGHWLSPSINMDDVHKFNHGWVDIEATIPEIHQLEVLYLMQLMTRLFLGMIISHSHSH